MGIVCSAHLFLLYTFAWLTLLQSGNLVIDNRWMTARTEHGFTLIELLVVIAIIAVIAAIVVVLVNPVEIMRRSRDATRLADLEGVSKAIQVGMQDNAGSSATFLCKSPATAPCSGTSNAAGNMRLSNGTGWVKINFGAMTTVTVTTLPVDPTNDATYRYTYASDGTSYELDAVLESTQYAGKMLNDGGNSNTAYETGSLLTVI